MYPIRCAVSGPVDSGWTPPLTISFHHCNRESRCFWKTFVSATYMPCYWEAYFSEGKKMYSRPLAWQPPSVEVSWNWRRLGRGPRRASDRPIPSENGPRQRRQRVSVGKISAKCCSFSAVSAPIFARKYAFCSIFQNLPDSQAEIFEIWQNFANFATFPSIRKFSP